MADATQATELKVGDLAPDFTLDSDNGPITLSELRGQDVILYFYPADDTPGCTVEACEFRDSNGDIKQAGAVTLGISPDDADSHRKFVKKFDLPFPLLADTNHEVAEKYGVWQLKKNFGKEYMGVVRSTFLIGADGRLRQIWHSVRPQGHAAEVLQSLVRV